jgi:hypothetical protein
VKQGPVLAAVQASTTVIAKYSDHLPLYRQSVMLERETGLEISRATLDGWVMTVGGLLIPMAPRMGIRARESTTWLGTWLIRTVSGCSRTALSSINDVNCVQYQLPI